MSISAVDDAQAGGAVADMYAAGGQHWRYLPNFTRIFSWRPQAKRAGRGS